MNRRRPLFLIGSCVIALMGAVACDEKAPTAPEPPEAPGRTLLVGTVLHSLTRAPIAGAVVTVQGQVAPAPRSVVTTEDGTFRLEAVLSGVGVLTVEANGFQALTEELTLTGVEVRTELALVPTAPPPPPDPPVATLVRGMVTNRLNNLAVRDATITFTAMMTGERFTTTTTNDGQFVLMDVVVGTVGDLRVEATGYWPNDQRITIELNQNLTIRLDPAPAGR
jgi:hypothetical protein